MRFKKILSAFLAAAITASSLGVVSSAQAPQTVVEMVESTYQVSGESFVSGDFKYTELEDGTLEVKCNNKEITKAVIPSTVKGKKVTSIGSNAFNYCTSLTSVTIPTSVTSIGRWAFENCTSLTSVTIPNSVTSIGNCAFTGCTSLTSVTIPNSVTSIGSSTFFGCTSLTSVTIPNSVTSIGSSTFFSCTSLTSVTIPNSATSIESSAFFGCTSLTTVTIPNSVTSIGSWAFEDCTSLTSVTIPQSVTNIGSQAFSSCTSLTAINVNENNKNYCSVNGVLFNKDKTGLIQYPEGKTAKSYTIPNSVTSIGNSAFYDCTSLTSVTIPNSVTSIGKFAFDCCTSLTTVTIPNSVTNIGNDAFKGCTSLTTVTIPNSVTSIGNDAFRGCTSLTEVTIPNSVTEIGICAFSGCTSLTEVTIPNSVTEIGSDAFSGCTSLTAINVNANNKEYCSVDGVLFNKDKSTLIKYPMGKASKSYTIPNSVTSISHNIFNGCTSLTTLTIPNSVTSIGSGAFHGCTSLKDVYYIGTKNQWNKIKIDWYGSTLHENVTFHYTSIPKLTGLKATPTDSTVGLAWDKETEASYYKVWTWKDGGALTQLTRTNNNTTVAYTVSNLAWNTSYKYRVSAYDKSGNVIAYNDITATTKYGTISDLSAAPSNSSVKLTWSKDAAAAYYKVWIWGNGKLTQLTQTKSNAVVTYTASKLAANTSYKFRVTAYNSSGKAIAYSDITSKTYGNIANLKAVPTSSSVKLTWGKYASASYYKVFIWKNSKWTQLTKTDSNATVAYTASKLTSNTSYKFRVTAYNSDGKAIAYSDITATTKYGTIASLKAAPAKNSVKLTWGKNESASCYKVFIWKDSKWTQLTQTTSNATVAYTASKLTANTSYKFRVTAYTGSGKAIAYSDITAKTTA